MTPSLREFVGVPCGHLTLYSLALDDLFCSDTPDFKHVVTVNSEIFTYAHELPELERILSGTINTIDGRVLQWICRWNHPHCSLKKLSGADFIYPLAEYCARRHERLFLLGASEESNRRAIAAFRARWPELPIAGFAPAFSSDINAPDWNGSVLQRIAAFSPTHLVVCFGPVKQEMWISHNSEQLSSLGVRCAYGLGGSLDFVAGMKKRAPRSIQFVGLEWLFRLLCEPRQRFSRTLKMFRMLRLASRPASSRLPFAGSGSERLTAGPG
jgi:N-acetylglucosaminyldiphosphoundecaprenol N-acetyl-beta-D-mannosaminyltransferase